MHLLLAIGFVFFAACKEKPPSDAQKTEAVDSASARQQVSKATKDVAPSEPLVLFRWPDGAQRFALSMISSLSSTGGGELMKVMLQGNLDVLAVDENDKTSLLLTISAPTLTLQGSDDPSKLAALQDEISTPFQGVYKNGKLEKMRFVPGSSTFAVGIWRSVLSYLQIADSKEGASPFSTDEYDNNGRYRALYTQVKTADQWQKQKVQYAQSLQENDFTPLESGRTPVPVLISSAGEIVLNNGRLLRVVFDDRLKMALAGSGSLISSTEMELTAAQEAPDMSPVAASLPKKLMVLRADEPFTAELPLDAMDVQRMEGLTFDTLLEALIAKANDPNRQKLWDKKNDKDAPKGQNAAAQKWTADWSRYFSAIPAFFRQQPKTLKRAEKEIRNGSPAARSLIGGLSSTGTQAAQDILLKLALDESLDIKVRESAVRNLVQCRLPTEKTAQSVMKLADHEVLSRYALYGVGIYARKFRTAGNVDFSAELVGWLLEKLGAESDAGNRRDLLRALSNTADDAILQPMTRLLQSAEPGDRAGALEALRLLTVNQVDAVLAERMIEANEPSELVRITAVQTAARRDRENPVLAALIAAAQKDSGKKVKREARRVLFGWSNDLPELKQTLETIAAADEVENAAAR